MFGKRFPEKRAFISGAASGLGLEIAQQLAADGWRLLIVDINEERLESVKAELEQAGATILSAVVNVANYDEIEKIAKLAEESWGGIDLVFNNAGVAGSGEMEKLSLEEWRRLIDIDLWSVIYGCRAFIPMLKNQKGGYIINTASSAGTLSAAQMANYNVAKAGVVSLSETLKVELSPFDVGVTVICPTIFKTALGDSMKDTAFDRNLKAKLLASKFTSAHVVRDVFKAMRKNKLYVMTQPDAKIGWLFKRLFPELFLSVQTFCYKRRIWIYSDLKD